MVNLKKIANLFLGAGVTTLIACNPKEADSGSASSKEADVHTLAGEVETMEIQPLPISSSLNAEPVAPDPVDQFRNLVSRELDNYFSSQWSRFQDTLESLKRRTQSVMIERFRMLFDRNPATELSGHYDNSLKLNERSAQKDGSVKQSERCDEEVLVESVDAISRDGLDCLSQEYQTFVSRLHSHRIGLVTEISQLFGINLNIEIQTFEENLRRLQANGDGEHLPSTQIGSGLQVIEELTLERVSPLVDQGEFDTWWAQSVAEPFEMRVADWKDRNLREMLQLKAAYVLKLSEIEAKYKFVNRKSERERKEAEDRERRRRWDEVHARHNEAIRNQFAGFAAKFGSPSDRKVPWVETISKSELERVLAKAASSADFDKKYKVWTELMTESVRARVEGIVGIREGIDTFDRKNSAHREKVSAYVTKETSVLIGFLDTDWGVVQQEHADGGRSVLETAFLDRVNQRFNKSRKMQAALNVWGSCPELGSHVLIKSFLRFKLDPNHDELHSMRGGKDLEYMFEMLIDQFR